MPRVRRAAILMAAAGAFVLGACDREAPSQSPAPKTGESSSPVSGGAPRVDAPPRTEPSTPQTAAQPALPSEGNAAKRSEDAAQRQAPDAERKRDTPEGKANDKSSAADDDTLAAKVKAALASDDEVQRVPIDVRSRRGRVVLSGHVEHKHQREQAGQIARGVTGVQSVENRLTDGS